MRKTGHGPAAGVLATALLLVPAAAAQPGQRPAASEAPQAEAAVTGEPATPATPSAAAPAGEPPPDASAAPGDATAELPATPQVPLARRLTVSAGATCLEPERLLRRIERWLERETVDEDILVRVAGDPEDEYEVVFTVRKGTGAAAERRISDAPEECGQLHAAVALSIALAIDAAIAEARLPEVELPDDETLVEVPEEEEEPYLRVAAALTGEASSGLLPGVALGVAGRFELGLVHWLDLRAGGLLTVANGERIGTDGTFSAELIAARLDLCAAWDGAPRARLLACAAGLVGRFRTAGQGFSPSEDQVELWVAMGLGVEAQVRTVEWLDIALSLDVVLPTARRMIQTVDTAGDVEDEVTLTKAGVLVAVGPIFHFF